MTKNGKFLLISAALAVALLLRYGFGLITPFLLGAALAFSAEPMAKRLEKKGKFPRKGAAYISVGVSLLIGTGALYFGGRLAFQALSRFANNLPDLQGGLQTVRSGLHTLADLAPQGAKAYLHRAVEEGFTDSQALLGKVATAAAGSVAAWVGKLSRWAVQLGTAILAGFMLSARLPSIKKWIYSKLPKAQNGVRALQASKQALLGWGKAQLKLMALCYGVVSTGLYIIGIKNGFLIGALVALVDAIPMLGTGTVLLPWALFQFLQGQTYKGVGLCLIFLLSFLLRAFLEPRLVGKQIGLDPLMALVAIYLGFQIWGIFGMLLFPVLGAVGKNVWTELFKNNL
jgi:sporulation integral membrane protein YtvI